MSLGGVTIGANKLKLISGPERKTWLPLMEVGETEIARLSLQSSTQDVISIRTRLDKKIIRYRIVDEYGTGFKLPQVTSNGPLSFGEFIVLIEGASVSDEIERAFGPRLPRQYREYNRQNGANPADLKSFITATSSFYPELRRWYETDSEEWWDSIR